MLKKLKAMSVFAATVVLLLTSQQNVLAYEQPNNTEYSYEQYDINLTDSTVLPNDFCSEDDFISESKVYEVCGGLPYHKMIAHGSGYVYVNGKTFIQYGSVFKCAHCNTVVVTEGRLIYGQMQSFGNYAILNTNEPLSNNCTSFYDPRTTGRTQANSLSGYKFFYQ